MKLKMIVGVIGLLLVTAPLTSSAAPIEGGAASYEYFNSFFTRLLPGTPFNMGSEPVDVLVESTGVLEEVWQPQSGDTIDFEIVSIVASGAAFPGDPPVPFQILGGIQQTPQLGPFLGSYTEIVQDEDDPGFATGAPSSLVSANRFAAGPFGQLLADGTFLYGEPYAFESTISGLPYPVGTEFIGTADSEAPIRVQLGPAPDPVNDPIIGFALPGGVVRITRVIPEPAAGILASIALVVLCRARSRRHGTARQWLS